MKGYDDVTYLDGERSGTLIFLRCSGQGSVQCRVCNKLSWISNAYARINKDNGFDYYCRDCVAALGTKDSKQADEHTNKRELEYIKREGLKLW